MKGLKTTLISVLAIGMLAGSTIAVAAQEEVASNAEFTAEWGFASFGCCTVVEPASDPRFEGDVSVAFGDGMYPFPDFFLRVASRAFRVDNDQGAWQGVPHVVTFHPDGTQSSATQVFIGEGDYAGSFAIVDMASTPGVGGGVELHGYIIEGEPPVATE